MADIEDLKKDLYKTLDSASQSGKALVGKGQEVSAAGQSIMDWAAVTREGAESLTDPKAIKDLQGSWDRTGQAALYLNIRLAGAVTLLTSTSDASNVSSLLNLPAATNEKWTAFAGTTTHETARRIEALAKRQEAYDLVLRLLNEFGFGTAPPGRLSPCEQFQTAQKEFSVGASAPGQSTSWLIPMRECILSVLTALLQRRSVQEESGGTAGKVESICRQLGRLGFPAGHFDSLSSECKRILDEELSPSKQTSLERLQSGSILYAATLWLKSFLSSLDPAKFRKPAR